MTVWLATLVALAALAGVSGFSSIDSGKCESIRIPLCADLPYNQTVMPNLMGNENQEEAAAEIRQYLTLVRLACSPDIQFFICAMFTPVCTIIKEALPPCRELCLSAKAGCEPLLLQFSYTWPDQFDCDSFPSASASASEGGSLCVGQANQTAFSDSDLARYKTTTPLPHRPGDYQQMMDFVCPAALEVPTELEYYLSIGRKPHLVDDCGAPCSKLFFGPEAIDQMRLWVGIWSIVCLLSTLFTLSTFMVDSGRFPYPEKPIVYLSMCYLIVAIVYTVGFSSGDAIACNEPFDSHSHGLRNERVMKQGTLHDWRCSILGMLLYFFVTAGSIWWVVLTVAWFLSAGLKWGQESIDVIASYFHAVAWTLASLQTIMVLILKKIEGDVLSGVCFVGVLDEGSLLYLIIVPFMLYLVVGFIFLVLGFVSLLQVRTIMKRDGARTDKLERLMLRIGTFSLLYMIPASAVVGCYVYEYIHLPDWMSLWQEKVCRDEVLAREWQVPCRYPDNQLPQVAPPNFHVFMLKYVMIFAIGIFSGFWVWSGKTVSTWKSFYSKICGGYRREAHV